MPRPPGARVTTSVLDLGNYSTLVFDLPSADSTVLLKVPTQSDIKKQTVRTMTIAHIFLFCLKMVPSVDPLPFKVVLGYKGYPTDTDFVAMTEMPLEGASLGEQTKPS